MGNLPLALSVASAYMIRCDVSTEEYLQRLKTLSYVTESSNQSVNLLSVANQSLFSSLSITLDRVCTESTVLASFLSSMGYLAPDQVSRSIISHLINTSFNKLDGPYCSISTLVDGSKDMHFSPFEIYSFVFGLFLALYISFVTDSKLLMSILLFLVIFFNIYSKYLRISAAKHKLNETLINQAIGAPLTCVGQVDVNKEKLPCDIDRCWELLKQFSLLIVRGSRNNRIGSIHRLQQSVMRQYIPQKFEFESPDFVVLGQRFFHMRSKGSFHSLLCLETAVWVIHKGWNFDIVDSTTCKYYLHIFYLEGILT